MAAPLSSLNSSISGLSVHTNHSNCHRKIQIWFANKPLPGRQQTAAAGGCERRGCGRRAVPRERVEKSQRRPQKRPQLDFPEWTPRVPRHKILGESGRGTAAGTLRTERPGEGSCGQVPAFSPVSGVYVCVRKTALPPRCLPGQGSAEGPPTRCTLLGFSARLPGPCFTSHHPRPRRGSEGTSRPPRLSGLGAPHPGNR